MPDRSQTEVVGYVLIFSVIVLTVALVTVAGEAGLRETRDTQQTTNIEKGYAVLAENVDDIVRGGVPSRATELDLSGEALSLGPPVTVRVVATDATGAETLNRSRSIRPLVYRADSGAKLIYVNGAVIGRGKAGGVALLRRPRLLLSPNRTVVPVIDTAADRRQLGVVEEAVGPESRVLVQTDRRERRILETTDQVGNLTLNVTSPRRVAWAEYLDEELSPIGGGCTVVGDTASCTYPTERATVVLTRVAVSFG